MEQEIRFCDVDGARVALATVGEGPALVLPAWWITHLEADWRRDSFRAFVEGLARSRTVVRYDRLGTGLSDRDSAPDDPSMEIELRTLDAVVGELGLERCDLLGLSCGGCIAAAFAAAHPERVGKLVVYGGYAAGDSIGSPEMRESMVSLVRSHWGFGSRMLAEVFMPEAGPPERREYADFQRAAATREVAARLLEEVYGFDVRDALGRLTLPALVMHRRGDAAVEFDCGRELAALLPGARFVALEGDAHLPWSRSARGVIEPVLRFLDDGRGSEPAAAPADEPLSEREREILSLVASGLSDRQIADALVLSPHTVHRHVANIRTKLRQPTRTAAAAEAARLQLI